MSAFERLQAVYASTEPVAPEIIQEAIEQWQAERASADAVLAEREAMDDLIRSLRSVRDAERTLADALYAAIEDGRALIIEEAQARWREARGR